MKASLASFRTLMNKKNNVGSSKHNNRFRTLLLVGFVVVFLIFQWFGGLAGSARSLATQAIESNQLDSAEYWLKISQWFESGNGESHFMRARLERKRGELDKMATSLRSAHDSGFSPSRLQREQSLALASLGRLTQDVEKELDEWLQEPTAETSEILDSYINGLTSISRYSESLELLNYWESQSPWSPIPNYRRARIQEHLSQFQLAEEQYKSAHQKDPRYAKAAYQYGRLLLQQRRPVEALVLFRKSERGLSDLAAKTGIARCLKETGKVDEARDILRQVLGNSIESQARSLRSVDDFSERYIAASELGSIETEAGNYEAAVEILKKALEVNPKDTIARYAYAVSLRGKGMVMESEQNFEIVRSARKALEKVSELQEKLRHTPDDSKVRMELGTLILEHESERTGVFWVQSIFSYDPSNEDAHRLLADWYANKANASDDDRRREEYHRSFLKLVSNSEKK